MLEEINKIDDEMLSKTLSIDTSLKLKEEIKREKIRNRKKVFKYFSLLATCSCLFIMGVFNLRLGIIYKTNFPYYK